MSSMFVHVLGHPNLPLRPDDYPEDAQIKTCWSFCRLLQYLQIPFAYYGLSKSQVPEGGVFVDCGRATGTWQFGNAWHREYTRRLNNSLKAFAKDNPATAVLVASLYGAAQSEVRLPFSAPIMEPMLGYNHCWTAYRVFPSYAQQHVIYATCQNCTASTKGNDAVIPHFLEPQEYPFVASHGDYLLYLGRDSEDKGVSIARQCADMTGLPLKIVHHGCSGADKSALLGGALAVLVPTQYCEPFGYVAVEAQMCGTPVVTTAWGAFTETVENGVTGFRCRTPAEFAEAVEACHLLDREAIRRRTLAKYSLEAVAESYSLYFQFVYDHFFLEEGFGPEFLQAKKHIRCATR